MKHEEFKQGADQRANAQAQEVRHLQEQLGELQRANAQLRNGADEAARQASVDLQVVQGQIGQLQVGAQADTPLVRGIPGVEGCRVACFQGGV